PICRARRASPHVTHAGHPLRHPLEPLRGHVRGRALERARATRTAEALRAFRRRARRGGLHRERADLVPPRPALAARNTRGRQAAPAGARRPAPPRHPAEVLLEEREMAPRPGAHGERSPRLLGAVRLPQRRRPVRGGAVCLLIPALRCVCEMTPSAEGRFTLPKGKARVEKTQSQEGGSWGEHRFPPRKIPPKRGTRQRPVPTKTCITQSSPVLPPSEWPSQRPLVFLGVGGNDVFPPPAPLPLRSRRLEREEPAGE